MSDKLGLVLGVGSLLTGGRVPLADYEFSAEGDNPLLPWRVREFTIEEEISAGYTARISIESDDQALDYEGLLGASATFVMRRERISERRFSGIIREVRSEGTSARALAPKPTSSSATRVWP